MHESKGYFEDVSLQRKVDESFPEVLDPLSALFQNALVLLLAAVV